MMKKILVTLLVVSLLSLSFVQAGPTVNRVVVRLLNENGQPVSGAAILIANGTNIIGGPTNTNSSGLAVFTFNYTFNRNAIVISRSSIIAFRGVTIQVNTTVNSLLDPNASASWSRVNITALFNNQSGTLSGITMHFYVTSPASLDAKVNDFSAPSVLRLRTGSSVNVTFPATVVKSGVNYRLHQIEYKNGTQTFTTNRTHVLVSPTFQYITVRYVPDTPMFFGIPLTTWMVVALAAVLIAVVAAVARSSRAAKMVLQKQRRIIRKEFYEYENGMNLAQTIDYDEETKKSIARRVVRRVE